MEPMTTPHLTEIAGRHVKVEDVIFDGPGGILEWHEEILDRMAGEDRAKRDRCNFTAWIEPKASENQFIYQMLSMKCPVILSLRAKEKIKIVPGKPPIDLGWQPIVGERIAFETIFTLMLPPHSKGVPDLSLSEMREPFDKMVKQGKQIDEQFGQELAQWASGGAASQPASKPVSHREADVPTNGQAMTDAEWTAAITRIDANEQWAEIKAAYKVKQGVKDLRTLKGDARMTFLAGLILHANQQGVQITI